MRELPGIYVHLPYCRSRCGYCSFVVSTDDSSRAAYLTALDRESALLANEAGGAVFDSIYLGGGTPSLLPTADLDRLLFDLRTRFRVEADSEVTLEANPDDVSVELAFAWRAAGVNRVSLGVQSLADRELTAVGRRHDARRALEAIAELQAASLSLSADLILGLPFQTAESFRASVARLARMGIGHLSVYLLEWDKSREMEEDRRLRPERYLSDDAQADLWLEMGETLAGWGLDHYEISNWARPGNAARHNVKYWKRTPTLGLGVSSHELWEGRRRANVAAIPAYIAALAEGRRPLALDRPIDREEAAREKVFLGLRLAEGVPGDEIEGLLRNRRDPQLAEDYAAWREEGLLVETQGRVRFSQRGFLVSNEVLCRLV